MSDRPLCKCHNEPMGVNPGSSGGWRCLVKARERDRLRSADRNARRIRMKAGGIEFYLGTAPTVEQAAQLRQKIRKGAPRAVVQDS